MSLFRRIITQLRRSANLFRRTSVDREIDAELKAHIEMRVEDNLATGMSPEEARRDALLRFGNATVMRERANDEDTSPLLAGIGRDIHYAFRQLHHSPGFALTAILTLALGIGANVVVLSVLNALILSRSICRMRIGIYMIVQKKQGNDNQSYPDYLDYRARNSTLTDMAAYQLDQVGLAFAGCCRNDGTIEVSGNYFDMLGVQPDSAASSMRATSTGPLRSLHRAQRCFLAQPLSRRSRCAWDHRRAQQASLHHYRRCTRKLPRDRAVHVAGFLYARS